MCDLATYLSAQAPSLVLLVNGMNTMLAGEVQRASGARVIEGRIKEEGSTAQVVSSYIQASGRSSATRERIWENPVLAPGNDKVRLRSVRVHPEDGSPSHLITMQTPFVIEIEYWNLVPDSRLHVTLHLYNEQGVVAFSTFPTNEAKWHGRPFPRGLFRSACRIPEHLLNSGLHRVLVLVVKDGRSVIYRHEDAVSFEVVDTLTRQGAWYGKEPGVVQPLLGWTTECLDRIQVFE